ncbi:hypothetical protein [Sanguibacter massiliensis]|uniref:hypothetical protein n=1 Tax=Sanguibacter massiliensis TaxID=1973217 RepID=UPI000C84E757|nr:hypothetical protein [Sanguibacter massiliensis]
MTPPCQRCGYAHSLYGSTSAIGRFSSLAPLYRADYDGSPLRATRAQAHADMCDHYATKENPS